MSIGNDSCRDSESGKFESRWKTRVGGIRFLSEIPMPEISRMFTLSFSEVMSNNISSKELQCSF